MHCTLLALTAASLLQSAYAFPVSMGIDNNLAMRQVEQVLAKRSAEAAMGIAPSKRDALPNGLSSISQFISGGGSEPYSFNFGTLPLTDLINIPLAFDVPGVLSTGKKAIPQSLYKAPGPTDVRGGCPGLNIMANYGFLDHSGITNPGEIIYALSEMLGNTIDIALGLIGVAFKAGSIDLTTMKFSIGPTDSRTSGPLTALAGGQAQGLFSTATHNKFEVDGSTGFNDRYFIDNGVDGKGFNVTRFQAAIARAQANGGVFDDAWIGQQKYAAWEECIATNPTCTWDPPTTLLFYAAQAYAELTMPSSDTGVPNTAGIDTVSSFWGYNTTSQQAIPSTLYPGVDGVWYRRDVPITAANLVQDGFLGFLSMPTQFGSNNGKSVNSFTAVTNPVADLSNTGAACFLINTALQAAPSSYGLFNAQVATLIGHLFLPVQTVLGCTQIT